MIVSNHWEACKAPACSRSTGMTLAADRRDFSDGVEQASKIVQTVRQDRHVSFFMRLKIKVNK